MVCLLELSALFFFFNIFDLRFVESADVEPVNMEGWPYLHLGAIFYASIAFLHRYFPVHTLPYLQKNKGCTITSQSFACFQDGLASFLGYVP